MKFFRDTIDSLDEQIAGLLVTRKTLSGLIGSLKQSDGHPRTDISRENEIVSHYTSRLGSHGASLAHDVLLFSKSGSA